MFQHFTLSLALAASFVFALADQADAATIDTIGNALSFNAVSTAAGMGTTEMAGAPGFNVPRWNNMVATGTSPFGGTITAGSVMDAQNTGVASGTSLSYSFTGALGGGNSGTGTQRMFDNEWDPFNSSPDLTITVADIPFTYYQVVTYHHSANFTANDRGGDVTVNGLTKALRMFQQDSDNPNGPFGYVEANYNGTFDVGTPSNVPRGTFVHFGGRLSGDLVLTVEDRFGARLRFSGFQILEVVPPPVPEPSSFLLLGLGALGLIRFAGRRRQA